MLAVKFIISLKYHILFKAEETVSIESFWINVTGVLGSSQRPCISSKINKSIKLNATFTFTFIADIDKFMTPSGQLSGHNCNWVKNIWLSSIMEDRRLIMNK